jgi:hypothetical protein
MAGPDREDAGNEAGQPARDLLMQEVAAQMDAIETDFGDNYSIGSVITIVEVHRPDGNLGIRVRSNVPLWTGLGLLQVAEKSLEAQAAQGG